MDSRHVDTAGAELPIGRTKGGGDPKQLGLALGLAVAIKQIVEVVGRVPPQERAELSEEIRSLVISEVEKELVADQETEEWVARLGRIYKARSAVAKAVSELQSAIAGYVQTYPEADRSYDAAPQSIDNLLSGVMEWARAKSRLEIKLAAIKAGARRGRPRGPKIDGFFSFSVLLMAAVEAFGGRLGFDKNYPTTSPLVTALGLLQPYMPRLIPEDINSAPPIRPLASAQKFFRQGPVAFARILDANGCYSNWSPSAEQKLLSRNEN